MSASPPAARAAALLAFPKADPATTFTRFGPDPLLSSLPKAFQACLQGSPGPSCDALVGSLAQGSGFCAEPEYAQTTFCACVNNAIPCPTVAAAACANSAFAYAPTDMRPPSGRTFLRCKSQPICVDLVEVGGGQNVVSGVTQQCGAITNVRRVLSASPALAALAFFAFLTLVALAVGAFTPTAARRPPPPPPPGLFDGVPAAGAAV
jgi:hypothetical protein